jgi:hypothetical protein
MKLQNQVCSLKSANELSKWGITQGKSVFFYDTWMADKNKLQFNSGHQNGDGYKNPESCFSAFTTAELLLMNGELITINNQQLPISAEAIADHLLGRLERDEVSAETCNSRLVE